MRTLPNRPLLTFLLLAALYVCAPLLQGGALASASAGAGPTFNAPIATTTNASYNWAGYVADEGSYTAVSATWVVPTIEARDSLAGDATWVGIGGVESSDLIQAGTQSLTENGRIEYQAWYEILPDISQTVSLTVRAGDSVTVALTEVAQGTWHILFINNTTGRSFSRLVDYASSGSSADWIEESPLVLGTRRLGLLPLVNFEPIVFRAASAVKDGTATTPQNAGALPLSLYNRRGGALAAPSIFGQDGASFSVMRVASAQRLQ